MPCLTDAIARDYISGRLPAAEQPEVRRHLDDCAHCRARLVVAADVWSPASAAEQRDQPLALSDPAGFSPPGMGIAATGEGLADPAPDDHPTTPRREPPDTDRLGDQAAASAAAARHDAARPAVESFGPPPPPMARGTMVGRYLIVDPLGAGGMSMVYSAYDSELDRKVALKFLHPGAERLGDLGPVRLRLMREAQALARLSHPHVVSIYDVGTHQGEVFIAMELVEGGSLAQWLAERPHSWREVLVPFLQAGTALAAAHAAGLVHRDFKPSNVLMGADGRARVVDFGLALPAAPGDATIPIFKLPRSTGPVSERDAVLTRVGIVLGTPAYMAPEQYLARPVDARTDQFSFCVALFEALYGQRPFAPGPDGSFGENVVAGRITEPPPGRRVPARLRRVVLRGLSVEPQDRYPSMDELLAALGRVSRGHVSWLIVAGVVLAVALGLNLSRALPRRADLACEDARPKLAGVWDGERKQRIGEALASRGPSAATAWRQTAAAIDAYVADWSKARQDVCEGTRRGRQTVEVRNLKLRCLDWQLEEVRALAALLEGGDEGVITRGFQMASRLSPQDQCGDLVTAARPRGAESEPQPDVLRAQIIRARVLFHAGKLPETVAAAREAAGSARAQGRRSVEADALHVLGTALIYAGDINGAEQALWASAAAAEAAGRDEGAANAWMELVYVYGYVGARSPARRALAEHCAEQAAAFIDRIGGSERLQAKLDLRRGTVALARGRYATAQAHFERALHSFERHAPSSSLMITTIEALGECLTGQGRLAAGAQHLERARALAEQETGPNHPRLGFYLVDLAAVSAALGRHEEAIARARSALELARRERRQHFLIADCLVRMADSHAALGRLDEALDHYRQALAALEPQVPAKDPRVAAVLVRLGAALRARGRLADAAAEGRRALPLLEEGLEPDHPELALALHELGLTLLAQRRPAAASALFERALAIREIAGGKPADLAATRFALARSLTAEARDPARAGALGRAARQGLAAAEGDVRLRLAELDAWLAAHPAGGGAPPR